MFSTDKFVEMILRNHAQIRDQGFRGLRMVWLRPDRPISILSDTPDRPGVVESTHVDELRFELTPTVADTIAFVRRLLEVTHYQVDALEAAIDEGRPVSLRTPVWPLEFVIEPLAEGYWIAALIDSSDPNFNAPSLTD